VVDTAAPGSSARTRPRCQRLENVHTINRADCRAPSRLLLDQRMVDEHPSSSPSSPRRASKTSLRPANAPGRRLRTSSARAATTGLRHDGDHEDQLDDAHRTRRRRTATQKARTTATTPTATSATPSTTRSPNLALSTSVMGPPRRRSTASAPPMLRSRMGDVPSLRDRRQTLLDDPDLKGLLSQGLRARGDVWLSAIAERRLREATRTTSPSSPSAATDAASSAPSATSTSCWSTPAAATCQGGRCHLVPCGTRGCISTTAFAAEGGARSSIWRPARRPRAPRRQGIWGEHKVAEPIIGVPSTSGGRGRGVARHPRRADAERHVNQGDVAFLLEPDLKRVTGAFATSTS